MLFLNTKSAIPTSYLKVIIGLIMKKYLWLILFFTSLLSFAQNNKQNIRGTVFDKLTQVPITGATIQITGNALKSGARSDTNGNYVLANVSPSRYEIKVSCVGYKNITISNVVVNSGKETILEIAMEENAMLVKEVVITVNEKDKPRNDLANISARTFSMEEVNRYAGGRSDPARLAANFAGVSAPDDSRNDIVIRGNSPVGVLWRIDGMNVTNPNHFSSVGTTGGAVSALNTNMLKSSDFLTSAFPAEYGNATSGVFDLGFRNGNSQKRETTVQLGVITGLEAMTEGPLNSENGSSYLVGYRYSLAGVAQAIGINIGTASTPSYQDLSFKINSGNTQYGKLSMFGILAGSNISLKVDRKPGANTLYAPGDNTDLTSNLGIVGLKHFKQLTGESFISSSIGINYSKNYQIQDSSDMTGNSVKRNEEVKVTKLAYEFISEYNLKVSSSLFIKMGVQDELMNLNLYYRTRRHLPEWRQIWDNNSNSNLAQAFVHAKYNLSENIIMNMGVHAQKFFLNNSFSVEPRFGLKYELSNSSFSFGYGLHSQMQPLNVYFLQTKNLDGSYNYNNKNLDFTKSHHFVLGYDLQPFVDWRLKAEAYYQSIYNVPVNTFSSSYSMLNTGAGFKSDLTDSLINSGTGKNYGVELTIEKFFSNGYYGLLTSSLYDSKYTASDGKERNTAFNGKYVYNVLFGKEWKVGYEKANTVTADFKFTNAGGRYYTPIDIEGSRATGHEQFQGEAYAYTSRYSNYFRMDFKIGYTINSANKQLSHSFALDLQNVTNHKNVFSQSYDHGEIKTTYQLGLFPNFIYRLQF